MRYEQSGIMVPKASFGACLRLEAHDEGPQQQDKKISRI